MSERTKLVRTAAPLRQQVVRFIREDILNGEFGPGQRLVEGALCDAYGVSRTVVREALRQLESEHLIQILPSKGPIVTVLSESDIRAIYVVRANLEALVGRLFAQNVKPETVSELLALNDRMEAEYRDGDVHTREKYKAEFYRILLEGSDNFALEEALRAIHARIAIFRRFAFVDQDRVALSMKELRNIIEMAAIKRDPDLAARACEKHITEAGELAILEYQKRAPEFDTS